MSAVAIMRTRFQTFINELKACALTTPKRGGRENPASIEDWGRRYAKVKNEQEVFKSRAPAFLKEQPCPMYLKQCDEYVSRVLCPAFMNFGYAPWKAEVEEMYGSDLEGSTGGGGKAVAQNAEFRVRPGDNDVTTKSGTSASLARGRRKGRATQARSLAKRVKPMEKHAPACVACAKGGRSCFGPEGMRCDYCAIARKKCEFPSDAVTISVAAPETQPMKKRRLSPDDGMEAAARAGLATSLARIQMQLRVMKHQYEGVRKAWKVQYGEEWSGHKDYDTLWNDPL